MFENDDYLYDNSPLVEVIAEIRWSLTPIASVQGAAIDPHFPTLQEEFIGRAKAAGFGFVERLLPEQVPLELVGGQPVFRCRRSAGQWPLYQFGPGVFTCNVVPRYEGWQAFRRVLEDGVRDLLASYPIPDKYLKLQVVELRYLDAFTKSHGLDTHVAFLREHLGLAVSVKEGFFERFGGSLDDTGVSLEVQFSAIRPGDSLCILKFDPGKKGQERALIGDIRVRSSKTPQPRLEDIMHWMDGAHGTLHDVFEFITSDDLKDLMGPKRRIKQSDG